MKNLLLVLVSVLYFQATVIAQNQTSDEIIEEGIAFHDAGKFDDAISKYQQVLDADNRNSRALLELSTTYMATGKYQECIGVCKSLLSVDLPEVYEKNVYVNMGSAYDNLDMPKKALDVFEKGLKKFPTFYLLYFNKGITLAKQEKNEDALQSFEDALKYKPLHISSNYYAAIYNEKTNRIPSVLAAGMFIILSPESEKASYCAGIIQKALGSNVRRDSANAMTIFLPREPTGNKARRTPNNFSDIEMTMALIGGLYMAKEMDSIAKTPADRLGFKIQMLINSLSLGVKVGKGFYWEFYVPFYIEMKEKNHVNTFAHLVLSHTDDADNKAWLAMHKEEVSALSNWVANYTWIR